MARILVVDDDPMVGKALSRRLRREGFDVAVAPSGLAALALVEGFAPDLVISDYRMPGMTGVELLEALGRRWPRARRILLSGDADPDVVLAVQGGGVRLVTKPWDDEPLVVLLRRLLAEGAPESTAEARA